MGYISGDTIHCISSDLFRQVKSRIENFHIRYSLPTADPKSPFSDQSLTELRSVLSSSDFTPKESAVIILLCASSPSPQTLDDLCLVFTKRTSSVSTHKGEVSFPGGRQDPCDSSLIETALRESQEEIGLPDPSYVTVLSALPPILTRFGYIVSPFIATLDKSFTPRVNPSEVELIFLLTLKRLLSQEGHGVSMLRQLPIHTYTDRVRTRGEVGEVEQVVTTFGLTANFALTTAYIVLDRSPDERMSPKNAFETYNGEMVAFAKANIAMLGLERKPRL